MTVQCELCPKGCVLEPGQAGDCRIRVNIDGELRATTYGYPCATHIDPVEKKPMFHFYPGSSAFSIATVGCNLHCKNCQNWSISQENPDNVTVVHLPPKQLVEQAKQTKCKSIAYTYTDPVVYYEYTFDSSVEAHKHNIENIFVTAGYINEKPLKELCKHLDGANIDLKAYSDKFYRDVCNATLKPVLKSLVTAKKAGVIVEVTNLLITNMNDSDKDINALSKWVKENMGAETPLHFSRFFPRYRMRNLPATPLKTLSRARDIAHSNDLQNVYIGNVFDPKSSNTYCPKCKKLLVERRVYRIISNVIKNSRCPDCKTKIYGKW